MSKIKIWVVAREKGIIDKIKKEFSLFEEYFECDRKNPEYIITIGGDGTLLYSERKFPGIPKVIIRDKSICKKCANHDFVSAMNKLIKKEFKIKIFEKVQAKIIKEGKLIKRTATNDIVVTNRLPYRALRFEIKTEKMQKEIIGDGIIFSTVFGSTGYFHSITRKSFSKGFGIAFNNSTEINEAIIGDNLKVEMEIKRNDSYLSTDNNPSLIILKEGDKIIFEKSDKFLRIVEFN